LYIVLLQIGSHAPTRKVPCTGPQASTTDPPQYKALRNQRRMDMHTEFIPD
jgi:hypothetical protein